MGERIEVYEETPPPELQETFQPEPWLRGTLTDVPSLGRAVIHALQLADEDIRKWCYALSDEELNARPYGLTSVAYHIRHVARSLHRLLTYAEGARLSEAQFAALRAEAEPDANHKDLFAEWTASIEATGRRVRILARLDPNQPRAVGRKALPTTVGGLLVHIADHTQRHAGQAITTAKLMLALRNS